MRFWYLMHQRAAKAVMNLRKCAVLRDHTHSTDVFEGSDQNSDLQILSIFFTGSADHYARIMGESSNFSKS